MKHVPVVVACVGQGGIHVLQALEIENLSPEQVDEGLHFENAISNCRLQGYKGPFLALDSDEFSALEGARSLIGSLKTSGLLMMGRGGNGEIKFAIIEGAQVSGAWSQADMRRSMEKAVEGLNEPYYIFGREGVESVGRVCNWVFERQRMQQAPTTCSEMQS